MNWSLAEAAHDPDFLDMCEALFREDPSPLPVSSQNMAKTLAALRADPVRGQAMVLTVDEKTAGYALLISFYSNELNGEICVIDELYVRPAFRGKGYGTKLIQSLIDRSFQFSKRFVAIDLEVTPQNARAQKLYLGLGFKPAKNTHMRFTRSGA